MKEIKNRKVELTSQILVDILRAFTDPTNRMPSDVEFAKAFKQEVLSNQNAREILFILALYDVSTGKAAFTKGIPQNRAQRPRNSQLDGAHGEVVGLLHAASDDERASITRRGTQQANAILQRGRSARDHHARYRAYRTMFAIAAMTGLRVGEVVGLQKADLDFDRRIIHVQRSARYSRVQTVKSKASRAPVAMAEALATLLKDYLATWKPNPEGFLFLNRNGRPHAANKVVDYGLWPVLDKLKIERAGMHAFRHCHASLLMDVGANPMVTKDQMRHSDARITLEVYGHVIGDSQRDAVDKVGELLRPKFCAQMRPN